MRIQPNRECELPVAKSDDHFDLMVADPSIRAFPEGSSYDSHMQAHGFTPPPPPVLTQAGDNAAQNAEVLVKNDKVSEDWINRRWRPAMGYMYLVVCIFDFIIAPILWSIVQAIGQGQVNMQWQPLTLQGAGLFHISMGAILGIAAYGRTKEKLEGKS